MSTKAELEKENKLLKTRVKELEGRSTGSSISNCTFESGRNEHDAAVDIAVANAVGEGMRALQKINSAARTGLVLNTCGR